MGLQEYSTEELKAELKRRAEQQSVNRCRMCKHWGEINYWGQPTDENTIYGQTRYCTFHTTKTGKYRGHPGSALACGYFEKKGGQNDNTGTEREEAGS